MKSRFIASLAAAGFVLTFATGCNMTTTQATTFEYTASDGVNLPPGETDGLSVRNAFVVADHDGAEGNFVAVLVNGTDQAQTLTIDWGDGDAAIDVPANETVSLGANAEPELLEDFGVMPGATVGMYIQPGLGEGVEMEVPVLNNCLEEYSDLAPNDEFDAEFCAPVLEVDTEH